MRLSRARIKTACCSGLNLSPVKVSTSVELAMRGWCTSRGVLAQVVVKVSDRPGVHLVTLGALEFLATPRTTPPVPVTKRRAGWLHDVSHRKTNRRSALSLLASHASLLSEIRLRAATVRGPLHNAVADCQGRGAVRRVHLAFTAWRRRCAVPCASQGLLWRAGGLHNLVGPTFLAARSA
jgi:hypothetical protein